MVCLPSPEEAGRRLQSGPFKQASAEGGEVAKGDWAHLGRVPEPEGGGRHGILQSPRQLAVLRHHCDSIRRHCRRVCNCTESRIETSPFSKAAPFSKALSLLTWRRAPPLQLSSHKAPLVRKHKKIYKHIADHLGGRRRGGRGGAA